MKKFILFPIYLGLLLLVGCFTPREETVSFGLIAISDAKCKECSMALRYDELDEFITAIRGVKGVEYYLNEDNTILVLTIRYNYNAVSIKNIKIAIKSKGFDVDVL